MRSAHTSVQRTLAQKLCQTFKVKVQQSLRLVTCLTKTFAVSLNELQGRLPERCTPHSTINSEGFAWGAQPIDVRKRMTVLGRKKGSAMVGCVCNGGRALLVREARSDTGHTMHTVTDFSDVHHA
jgi:hypothetical protein